MTPLAQRAKDIFLDVVALDPPERRAAFLDEACAGDPALRHRVEALLSAHDRPESLLDRAAVAVEAPATLPLGDAEPSRPAEGPGTVIGPYTLLERLGEGGMGAVYLAEQTVPVRRRVALKVIKPGMDSAQVLARFETEKQALALMEHPNIARVLDAGTTPAGRPFFVMELVRGVAITDYCDDTRLNPRERLELFLPVCQAVQHAHQKGVIHRDLKPSNVLVTLVDGKPVPKVIDFGVAKAIEQQRAERTLFTRIGAVVGTPEYMSPEQAGASPDVDTRTDVYGLGVLLYELLTGTTPIDRASLTRAALDEVLRRVREEEPPRPSTRLSGTSDRLPSVAAVRATEPARLAKLMRGDLDWVVMKALEKDRARRYETANGLARDIQRYLDGDPVEAGPPSRLYRLRKFARKHRAGLAAVGAVILGLVVAVSALAVSTVVIARGRADALRELAKVRAERRELAHAYFVENALVGEAMGDIKKRAFDLESWKRREFELVDRAVQFQELFARQLLSDPEARLEAAFCYYKSGDNEAGLSIHDPSAESRRRRHEHAVASQRKAVELLAQLHADAPGRRDYADALRAALSHLGLLLLGSEPLPSEAALRQALAIDDEVAAARLTTPDGWKPWPAGRMYAGRGIHVLARIVARDRPDDAEALFLRSMARLEEWSREYPPDAKGLRVELQKSQLDLIMFLLQRGKRDEADRRLYELTREDLDDHLVCNDVAWFLATSPDPHFRDSIRAVPLARKAVAREPEEGNNWNTLGVALYRTGAWDEAIEALTKSTELTRGDYPPASDWLFLAMAHWQKGDRAVARAWYDKAVAWLDRNRPDEELTRFRAEAEALLRPGNPDGAMPSGPDAFVP
jgi:serine/threonine protein kinase/tetratricopeptide (TPR) repeat protein